MSEHTCGTHEFSPHLGDTCDGCDKQAEMAEEIERLEVEQAKACITLTETENARDKAEAQRDALAASVAEFVEFYDTWIAIDGVKDEAANLQ